MGTQSSSKTIQRFEYEDKRQQVADIEAMIADFLRIAEELEQQIEAEQRASGISDVNHFAYPTFARAAAIRRDNLRSSIRDLEQRLVSARRELKDISEQVKTAEIAEGLELERFSKSPSGRRKSSRFYNAFGGSR